MLLQMFSSIDGERVFIFEASHQKEPKILELLMKLQEGLYQLGNAFVTCEAPDK
jgi:hypothetical protein